jgi:diacylglycerol O-acyltransferase / wax synthase
MALMRVMMALTDQTPDAPVAGAAREHRAHRSQAGAGRALRTVRKAFSSPVRLLGAASYLAESAYVLARLTLMPAEPQSIVRGPLGVRKRVAWSEPISIDQLRAIGHAADATVNDVLLAAVAGALRHYSVVAHRRLPAIRVTVPYNLRPLDLAGELGNGFTLVYLDLPVTEPRPRRRLQLVRQAMRAIKASPEPWVTFGVLNSVGLLPPPLQKLAINFFGSKASAVITNVPGPRQTVYLAGHPIRHALFWEPESAGIGLGVSIFSYAGEVVVGVIADAGLIPDPRAIVAQVPLEVTRLAAPRPAAARAPRPAAPARPPRPRHTRPAAA